MLHWIYVKKNFRGMGIGGRLMKQAFGPLPDPIEATSWTRDLAHLKKWSLVKRSYGLIEVTL